MKKKSIIIISMLFIILVLGTISFATNDLKNDINSATNSIVDGAENLSEDVKSGISTVENTLEEGARDIGTAVSDGVNDVSGAVESGYTATKTTATDMTNNTMNSSIWTWVILAIAAIVIIGLVWYYAMQKNDNER